MITVDSESLSQLNKDQTFPLFLIQCSFGPQEYNSTGYTITTLGQDWIEGGIDFRGASDWSSVQIGMDNSDYSLSQSVNNGDYRYAALNIWLCIIKEPEFRDYAVFEPDVFEPGVFEEQTNIALEVISTTKFFSGELVSCSDSMAEVLVFNAKRVGIDTTYSPRVRISTESGFNFLPSSGDVFIREGTTYTVE